MSHEIEMSRATFPYLITKRNNTHDCAIMHASMQPRIYVSTYIGAPGGTHEPDNI